LNPTPFYLYKDSPTSYSFTKEGQYSVPQSRQRKINKARKRPRVPSSGSLQSHPAQNRNLKVGAIILIAVIAVVVIAYIMTVRRSSSTGQEITTASGLKYVDLKVGDGPSPKVGQTVTVHYVGTLENGTKFDSSFDRGKPYDTPIGVGRVIKAWDEGVMTMKVGGKRKLLVPAELGYGRRGSPPNIPPNANLIFEVELLGIK
jgi:hypothetical protein